MDKKAQGMPFNVVVIAAIVLIVLIVVIAIFGGLFGKEASQIEEQIAALDDADEDGVLNLYDKCPCQSGDRDNDGCPIGVTPPSPKPKTCP